MDHIITTELVRSYEAHLRREERAEATVEKYLRHVGRFRRWLEGRGVTKELTAAWKDALRQSGLSPKTVNGALAALHSFFDFAGWGELRVKYLKTQRQMFRDADRELGKGDYLRLVGVARARGNERLALVMETICATGIRVSELGYITAEAVARGRADVSLKGKIRTILLPKKLVRKLRIYAKKQKILSGPVFLTSGGKGLSRRQIWGEMKALCAVAGVDPRKVFPHNLRHLFARGFYDACKDIVHLADVLGHSSIETTRIYLLGSGEEQVKRLDRLGLVT